MYKQNKEIIVYHMPSILQKEVQGRVEYKYDGYHWGTVCDDYFTLTSANVLCNSINPFYWAADFTNQGSLSG